MAAPSSPRAPPADASATLDATTPSPPPPADAAPAHSAQPIASHQSPASDTKTHDTQPDLAADESIAAPSRAIAKTKVAVMDVVEPQSLDQPQNPQEHVLQHSPSLETVPQQQQQQQKPTQETTLPPASIATSPPPPPPAVADVGGSSPPVDPIAPDSTTSETPSQSNDTPRNAASQPPTKSTLEPPYDGVEIGGMNVNDALIYLEKAKRLLVNKPHIYQRFLAVMRDFRLSSVDAIDVIQRVISLFRSFPELILGFNPFLPDGFNIAYLDDGRVTVTTPQGFYRYKLAADHSSATGSPIEDDLDAVAVPIEYVKRDTTSASQHESIPTDAKFKRQSSNVSTYSTGMRAASNIISTMSSTSTAEMHATDPNSLANGAPVSTPATASSTGQNAPGVASIPTEDASQTSKTVKTGKHSNAGRPPKTIVDNNTDVKPSPQGTTAAAAAAARPPVEFNHAIKYVNKVKTRYSKDPEVYRYFLDILQVYQRDQKPIQQVYAQVKELFADSPDLLEEFQQFLPDNSGQEAGIQQTDDIGLQPTSYDPTQGAVHAAPTPATSGRKGKKGKGSFNQQQQQPTPQQQQQQQQQPPPPMPTHMLDRQGGYMPYMQQQPLPPQSQQQQPPPPPMGAVPGSLKRGYPDSGRYGEMIPPGMGVAPPPPPPHGMMMMPPPPPMGAMPPPMKQAKRVQPSEELLFFEKCKRVMGSKQIYNEFLKILNLFSQQIIEAKVLVERVEPFLAKSPELFEWFKKFVKYEEEETVFNIPVPRPRLDLRNERQHGRSYRRIPDDVPRLVCSGRDDLCREVLNDDWLSVPIYVAESGFVSHKKTQFEDVLHNCEEQRYEFDMNINNNLHTIALLEPIAKRIQKMTADEKSKFKLEDGLGGFSKSIYKKVIKLIYDKEKGLEVIDALHNNPAVAVPVVLNRLKQKDQEWRRLQREWNKVWRDTDNKNYYRALDHQSTLFKSYDKKAIVPKSLTSEIENIVKEQQEQFAIQQLHHEREAERLTELYRERRPLHHGKQLNTRSTFLKAIESKPEPATADHGSLGSLMPGSVPSRINNCTTVVDPETCKVLVIGESPQTERYQFEFLFRDSQIFEDIRGLINRIHNNTDSGEEPDGNESDGQSGLDDSIKQRAVLKDFIGVLFNAIPKDGFKSRATTAADKLAVQDDAMNVDEKPDTNNGGGVEPINGTLNGVLDGEDGTDSKAQGSGGLRYALGKSSVNNFESRSGVILGDNASDISTTASNAPGANTVRTANGDYVPTAADLSFPLPARATNVLYGSSNFYYFVRLYQLVYVRLLKLKNISKELLEHPPRWTRKSELAQRLGLQSRALDEYLHADRYALLLKLIEDLCQGQIDTASFEENCRRMFGTSAYISFTMDRLLSGLVKQINALTGDSKNLKLLDRFYMERQSATPNEAEYRLFVEPLLVEDKIYRFEFFTEEEVLTVKLLTKDEYLTEQLLTPDQEWSLYIDSFIQTRQTRPSLLGIPGSTRLSEINNPRNFVGGNMNLAAIYGNKLTHHSSNSQRATPATTTAVAAATNAASGYAVICRRPFLLRNLPTEIPIESSRDVLTSSALKIKFYSNVYKMIFIPGTEDYFFRFRKANENESKKSIVGRRTLTETFKGKA